MRFAAEAQAVCVAKIEGGPALSEDRFGAGDGAGKGLAGEMALGGARQVVVPDVVEGGVEADAFEAVIEADGPMLLAREGGKGDLGEVFEAGDLVEACVELGRHGGWMVVASGVMIRRMRVMCGFGPLDGRDLSTSCASVEMTEGLQQRLGRLGRDVHLELGAEAEASGEAIPDFGGESAAGGLVVAIAVGGVRLERAVVGKELDEVDAGGRAAGEVDPTGAKTGIDAEDDGLGKAGTPLLGDQRVDLAGGVHADSDEVGAELVANGGGEAGRKLAGEGEGEGIADLGFGYEELVAESREGGVRILEGLLGGVGEEEKSEGRGSVSGGGPAWSVEQRGEIAEGAAGEEFFRGGKFGEGRLIAEVRQKGDGGKPKESFGLVGDEGLAQRKAMRPVVGISLASSPGPVSR